MSWRGGSLEGRLDVWEPGGELLGRRAVGEKSCWGEEGNCIGEGGWITGEQ